jgi:hypothetical protein
MYIELFEYVYQIFFDVGIFLDRIDNLRSILTTLSENEDIYTGKSYYPKNQLLKNFIDIMEQQSESFRSFLINFAIKDFNNKLNLTT